MIHHPLVLPVGIWTDASGSFGCGALCPALSRWFQLSWRGTEICRVMDGDRSITWMELLRNNVDYLHSQVFQAAYQCDPTPEDLVTLLLVEQPDWTCFHWTRLFKNCLRLAISLFLRHVQYSRPFSCT